MSTLQEEVLVLQKQLAAKQAIIDQQIKEAKERTEKSWEYNIDIIPQQIKAATAGRELPSYRMGNFGSRRKSVPLPSNVAERRVCNYLQPFMTSVLECLQRLDERIKQLEN